jgi:catechol 2,3-dioxygenase-like lactoylglutathione lyase family enzyme
MLNRVSHVSIVVRDQQEALEWYTEKLGFEAVADEAMEGREGRWLTIAPPAQAELEILLEPLTWGLGGDDPEDKEELLGRNGVVFGADDCAATVEELRGEGVEIVSEPEELPWGISALFEDLYGNVHNVVEPHPADTGVPDVA